MPKNTLVNTVRASGYMPEQIKGPPVKPAKVTNNNQFTAADTKKGQSRAFVSKDSMPVSFEPFKSPRSKTLAQLGRGIKSE